MIITPVPAAGTPVGLTPQNLTVPKERTYFTIVLLLSLAVWLALAVTIIGAVYAGFIGLFLWLGNGLLTAHLRAEAVRVGPEQLPELNATFGEVCSRLGVTHPPALYVVQSGGLLNAFATRFAGRDFVVVYSDFLEALGPSSPEMKFILGHELGHVKSNHVLKHVLLAPGLFFPLIGPAYRRAWETSCDRHGAFAAQDVAAAVRAMLVLGGGRGHGKALNAAAFAGQYVDERGFFVSLHELTSTYPTLSRRVTDLMALHDGRPSRPAPRNPFAYFVALFMPGGQVGGGGGGASGVLVTVVVIGLLAAMAIPAFQKVRQASQAKVCINNERMLVAALDQYRLEHGRSPKSWDEIVGPGKLIPQMPKCLLGGTYTVKFEGNEYEVRCSVKGHNADEYMAAAAPAPR